MELWYEESRDLAPLKAIPKEKIIVFDTETTGFNADEDDDILQLSIADGNGKALFNEYVNYPLSKANGLPASQISQPTVSTGVYSGSSCPILTSL